jgi:hypothetical protein
MNDESAVRRATEHSRPEEAESGWHERIPPIGTIGYTSSYRDQPPEIADVSVVSVLEARGPE